MLHGLASIALRAGARFCHCYHFASVAMIPARKRPAWPLRGRLGQKDRAGGGNFVAVESSTVLAFRIFVMLSCLIIVPMAAIFGSAFPDVVKSVLVDRLVAWGTGKPYEPSKTAAEPSGFSQVTSTAAEIAERNGGNNWEAPRWPTQNTTAGAWQTGQAGPQGGGAPAVAAETSPGGAIQAGSSVAVADPRATAPAYPPERAMGQAPNRVPPTQGAVPQAAPYPYPANPAAAANVASAPVSDPAAPPSGHVARPPEQPDRFTAMERKLREHGATYYLLETWGNDGELYRFHCRMAISNNPNYTRQFEATDHDALKAMSQVLERVEAWRAGRLQ
jgi:hypothetical protein